MPQAQLPIFPASSSAINAELGFECRNGVVFYFNGHLPVFQHAAGDLASFRMFTSQLIEQGTASQGEIASAFGIPLITIKRGCKLLREQGVKAFFVPAKPKEGTRLTPDLLLQAQSLLDDGLSIPAVSEVLGVLQTTLHKAVSSGRLFKKKVLAERNGSDSAEPDSAEPDSAEPESSEPESSEPESSESKNSMSPVAASTQSGRTVADGLSPMGVATGRTLERMAASVGLLHSAQPVFEACDDIPNGGVLCALPALLSLGLLRYGDSHFDWPKKAYYPIESVFIILAFMALARVQSLEQLRYQAPGEWGKLIGFDRIPEVKTLRDKIGLLGDDLTRTAAWSSKLARDWMAHDVTAAGVLLIDGHIRVYHGELANLPRRYVSRERLCLRGTTDYWVNALDGQPFFCVTKAIDPGLQKVIKEDIVPRLLTDVPGQPTLEQLNANPFLHRFLLIFDREGYSPDFFSELKKQRIAILSYHKNPGADWPKEEFTDCLIRHPNGEETTARLAERGTCLSNGLWVREVRHLDEKGHQTSIISTDFVNDLLQLTGRIWSRWNQENFFKYMRQHYGLDKLVEHGISPLPDTTKLVNPTWRRLDSQARRQAGELTRERARFAARTLTPQDASPAAIARHEQKKGEILVRIQTKEGELAETKAQRKTHPRHIELKDLPEADRVNQLIQGRKHFVDTIKLISYRAETALVLIARQSLRREDDARSFIRSLFRTTIDLRPDLNAKTLTVRLHGQANSAHDTVLHALCEELTQLEMTYPATELKMIYTPLRPLPTAPDCRACPSPSDIEGGMSD
jgi:hypothetical protein